MSKKQKKDKKGKKEFQNSQVEIVNPDLVIGHIVDMAGSLKADIYVSRGQGYVMIENREKTEKEVDYIEMDSIFSPVAGVGIKVEYVRVGKVTNFDKLSIDLKTDGTITPREAFEQSVNILIEQFNSLLKQPEAAAAAASEPAAAAAPALSSAGEQPEPAVEPEVEEKKKKRGRPRKTD